MHRIPKVKYMCPSCGSIFRARPHKRAITGTYVAACPSCTMEVDSDDALIPVYWPAVKDTLTLPFRVAYAVLGHTLSRLTDWKQSEVLRAVRNLRPRIKKVPQALKLVSDQQAYFAPSTDNIEVYAIMGDGTLQRVPNLLSYSVNWELLTAPYLNLVLTVMDGGLTIQTTNSPQGFVFQAGRRNSMWMGFSGFEPKRINHAANNDPTSLLRVSVHGTAKNLVMWKRGRAVSTYLSASSSGFEPKLNPDVCEQLALPPVYKTWLPPCDGTGRFSYSHLPF